MTQDRLNAIKISIDEYSQVLEQAHYGADLALKTREYHHLKKCAEKLVHAQEQMNLLSIEAKELQIKLDLERIEV